MDHYREIENSVQHHEPIDRIHEEELSLTE